MLQTVRKLYRFIYLNEKPNEIDLSKVWVVFQELNDTFIREKLLGLVDINGNNVLHYALGNSCLDAFEPIYVPHLRHKNNNGETPIDHIKDYRMLETIFYESPDSFAYSKLGQMLNTLPNHPDYRGTLKYMLLHCKSIYDYYLDRTDSTWHPNLGTVTILLSSMKPEAIRKFSRLRGNVNRNLLHEVCFHSDESPYKYKIMDVILSATGDKLLNMKDDYGRTPLHYNSYFSDKGAHLDAVDRFGVLAHSRTLNLQCIAARHLSNMNGVPKHLIEFVKLHQPI